MGVCGSKGLKRTQEYTAEFATKLFECFLTFRAASATDSCEHDALSDDEPDSEPANEACETAILPE
eukprot:8929302-Pyramimonas_sp.AAC.1